MAVDLPEVHAHALEVTRRYVGGVDTPDWDKPSVCSEWNVRELVNHIVSGNLWVPELVGGKSIADVGDRLDGDVLGADPVTAYESSEAVAAAAFRPRARWTRRSRCRTGRCPARSTAATASSTC